MSPPGGGLRAPAAGLARKSSRRATILRDSNTMTNRILLSLFLAASSLAAQETKFEISFSPSSHAAPITGRVFVALAKSDSPEPVRLIGSWNG